jgi:cell division protein FtsB
MRKRNYSAGRGYKAARRGGKKKYVPASVLKSAAVFAFVAWCLFSIVSAQSEMAGKKSELEALKEKTAAFELENEEYRSILSEEDERAFVERIAIDTLGYAYPNERRFVDKTRN